MSPPRFHQPLPALLIVVLALAACAAPSRSSSRVQPTATASASELALDSVYSSPTGLFTIRYNHTWPHQEIASQAGPADYFKLPTATFAITSARVQPGTQLETYVQAQIDEYHSVNIQGVERDGPITVAGGHAELLHAVTYVDAQGNTVAQAPAPDAKPRNLYQAFYLVGDQSFTFSIAWPQDDRTDYLQLFRSLLQTFTLASAS